MLPGSPPLPDNFARHYSGQMPGPGGETRGRRANRGRGAAEENRAALVAAAREVFSDQGYDAPLSSVARRAGVGQGSLYRHFPDRVSLALAAFEENVAALELLAADPGTTLDDCFALLTEQTLAAAAFLPGLAGRVADDRISGVAARVTRVLAAKLAAAQAAGRYRADLVPRDCYLAVAMVAGVIAQSPAAARREVAGQAWSLLRRALLA